MGEEQNDRDVLFTMNQKCKKCDTGYMKFDGVAKTSSPPLYSHTCDTCGIKEDYKRAYPKTVLEGRPTGSSMKSINYEKLKKVALRQGVVIERTLGGSGVYDESGNKLYNLDELLPDILSEEE